MRTYDVGDTVLRVVAGPDGTLLAGVGISSTAGTELIALDVASGAVRWRGDLLASPEAMAVTATSVYVVGWGRLEAFDIDGCATRFCSPVWVSSPWEVPTQAPGLIAVAGGVVYAQTDAFHVGAYAADGCGELFCPPIADIHETQVGGLLVSGGRLIISRVPLDRNQATIEVYAPA